MQQEWSKQLIPLIKTKDQAWIKHIANCVTENDADSLRRAVSSEDSSFKTLTMGLEGDDDIGDEFAGWATAPSPGRAVHGVAALARSILEPSNRERLLQDALDIFETNGIACAQSRVPLRSRQQGEVSRKNCSENSVLNSLNMVDSPAAGFTKLLASYLGDSFPKRLGKLVQLPVLLEVRTAEHRDVAESGLGALLQLERLSEGPAGLYADPRTMTFTQCDNDFTNAIYTAWNSSGLSDTDTCVVWSLFSGNSVLDNVRGYSMGAAFAVGLDEWKPRSGLKRLLHRFKAFDSSCAVTGRLSGQQILPVTGYENKLWAAAKNHWRVVAPKASKAEIEASRSRISNYRTLDIGYVDSVSQAVRRVRHGVDFKFAVYTVSTILAIALTGVFTSFLHEQKIRTKSAELAGLSLNEVQSNPRLSALTALMAYRINPSADAARALRTVSEEYSGVVGSVAAHDLPVSSLTHAGSYTLSTDSGGLLSLWDTNRRLNSVIQFGARVGHLAGSVDGTLAAGSVDNDIVIISVSDEGQLDEQARVSIDDVDYFDSMSELVSIIIAPNGSEIRLINDKGLVARYDPYGRLLGYTNVEMKLGVTYDNSPVWITASSLYMGGYIPNTICDGDCILFGTSNGNVYLHNPETDSLKLLFDIPNSPEGESVRALSCDDSVIVAGTVHGVHVWDQQTGEIAMLPLPSKNSSVHEVVVTTDGQIGVLVGGAIDATTALYLETGERSAATQTISGTAIGVTGNYRGLTVGTSDGRLVFLNRQEDRSSLRLPGTTALGMTSEGNIVQTNGVNPMHIRGLRILRMDDAQPDKFSVLQELNGPADWASDGWYVNDIDTTGDYVAASGLTPSMESGSIVVWNARRNKVVAVLTSGLESDEQNSEKPPIITKVKFLGKSDLIAGYNYSTGNLVVFSISEKTTVIRNSPIVQRHLGAGLGAMEYCESNDTLYVLTWPAESTFGNNHTLIAIDASSGVTRWTIPVGAAVRMTADPVTGDIAVPDGSTLTVYSEQNGSIIRKGDLRAPAQSLTWSPDGKKIAVAGAGGSLDIIDSTEMIFSTPTMRIGTGLDFSEFLWSPDSQKLVVGTVFEDSSGNRVGDYTYIVHTDSKDWMNRMCEIAGSGLSENEWKMYVGELVPYEEVCPTRPQ